MTQRFALGAEEEEEDESPPFFRAKWGTIPTAFSRIKKEEREKKSYFEGERGEGERGGLEFNIYQQCKFSFFLPSFVTKA